GALAAAPGAHTIPVTLASLADQQMPATPASSGWAVADLVILGLAFCALVVFFSILLARNVRQPAAAAGDQGQAKKPKKPKSPLDSCRFWLVISTVAAVLIVFVYAASQNFSGEVQAFDNWTSTVFLLLLIQALAMILALRNDKASRLAALEPSDEDFNDDDYSPALRQGSRLKLRSDQAGRLEKDELKSKIQSKNEKG
ncbi:MAG: hypothetical protein FWF30_00740, partial [Coriobacteriia bacterium]|nr:hypothetical protein [Coriobacteriia bacterium]